MFVDEKLDFLNRAMARLAMVLDSLDYIIDFLSRIEDNTVYGVFGMLCESLDRVYDDLDRYTLNRDALDKEVAP